MRANPYGCHSQALTGPAKNTMLAQRNGRILKLVSPITLDRNFLEQMRANNPDMLIIYRHYFGDNNLGDPEGRAREIVEAVTPVADIVDVCETGYNETAEGINDGIRDLAQAEMRVANRIRAGLPRMKVAGGCFSVGTPYGDVTKGEFQDIEAYAAAFGQLDYWAPHEYGDPQIASGFKFKNKRIYGDKVLRYRYVVDWARQEGVKLPPIILGEFGLDYGGAGKGFRNYDTTVGDYMQQAREIAPAFMADIASGILAGVVFFCVGQDDPDSWSSFDLAGESAFRSLITAQFGDVSAQAAPSATSTPERSDGPHGVSVGKPVSREDALRVSRNTIERAESERKPLSEYQQWIGDPRNKHNPENRADFLQAFIEHREANAGVAPGTFGVQDALAGGYPANLLPDPVPAPSILEIRERMTAKRLGVPVERVRAVHKIESNGEPFSAEDRATIRFELHDWLPAVPVERMAWANKYFRTDRGIEQINDGAGNWSSVQNKSQAGRWADLTLAVQISGDLAFQWTSMGLFQILGLHYDKLHYDSAGDMLQEFSHNEGAQWRGFEDFVLADERLHKAMIDGDAERFALLYNGNAKLYAPLLWRAGWK